MAHHLEIIPYLTCADSVSMGGVPFVWFSSPSCDPNSKLLFRKEWIRMCKGLAKSMKKYNQIVFKNVQPY